MSAKGRSQSSAISRANAKIYPVVYDFAKHAEVPEGSQATTDNMSASGDVFATQQDLLPLMGESLERHLNGGSIKHSPSAGALMNANERAQEQVSPEELKRDACSEATANRHHALGRIVLDDMSVSRAPLVSSTPFTRVEFHFRSRF